MNDATVLIVEDNPMNMELATDLLEIAGYEVLQAENAELGLQMAREHQPTLILMDLALPGMDGLTATGILKGDEATRAIPVVALTAQAMKGDMERALEAGCNGYLSKPIDTRTFIASVKQYLDQ